MNIHRPTRSASIAFLAGSVCLLLLAMVAIVQTSNASSNTRIYHSDPVLGSYPFIAKSSGYISKNGYAYSYVTLDTPLAKAGSTFYMRPSINSKISGESNFTVSVTYGGYSSRGSSLELFIPSNGEYLTMSGDYGTFANQTDSFFSPGVVLYTVVGAASPANGQQTLFVYIGPSGMPSPPFVDGSFV